MIDSQSFVIGFISGGVIALVLGSLVSQIRKNRSISRRPSRKVAVGVKGEQSPREILRSSANASARMMGWIFVFLLSAGAVAVFLYWVWTQ